MLRALTLLTILGGLATIVAMLHVPIASVRFLQGDGGAVRIVEGVRGRTVPGTLPVRFTAPDGAVGIVAAADLTDLAEPRGPHAANVAQRAMRDRIAAMVRAGPVAIRAGDLRLIAHSRPRVMADLSAHFWLPLLSGMVMLVAGLWVWALRPRSTPARLFALSGVGFFLGCATLALNGSAGLGLSGVGFGAFITINYVGALAVGFALLAIFARFPRPLVARGWLIGLGILSLIGAADVAFEFTPAAVDLALGLSAVECIGIAILIAWQAWASRRVPADRAALMPIAIGTGIASSLFCILSIAPQIGGNPPIVGPDIASPLLLLIYFGLGLAITRARLFALGQWAVRLLLSTGTIILALTIEPIVVSTLTMRDDIAFAIAGLIAVALYLVARDWIVRREERERAQRTQRLLVLAGDIAFARSPEAARIAWREVAQAMFAPLEIQAGPVENPAVAMDADGTTLTLPLPEIGETLRLRFPGSGARLFTDEDRDTASRFREVARQLVAARDAYFRGVSEERQRIARDLHDDVSARLLTSLHRAEPGPLREDIRGAMADIRAIVSGLTDAAEPIDAVLADLRHETQGRLEAAGIALDWPVGDELDGLGALDPMRQRDLVSIVRECVSNVIRHAGAGRVQVDIARNDDGLTIRIIDDGCGLAGASEGHGTVNAARRAAALGGDFQIVDAPPGTCATLRFPLPRSGEGQAPAPAVEPAPCGGQ